MGTKTCPKCYMGAVGPLCHEHETAKKTESLGEALPREMTRVRDEVMPPYLEIGASG